MGRQQQRQKRPKGDGLEALAALRLSAVSQLVPGSVSTVEDTSLQTLPRILGSEVAWRSRMVEELHLMQTVLTREMFREVKERPHASLPALVREIRACITDSMKIVQGAPIGTGTDAARTQVRDLLQRHALIAAELRRKGLGELLERIHGKSEQALRALPAGVAELLAAQVPAGGEREPESEAGVS
jgi:hypothetical protein